MAPYIVYYFNCQDDVHACTILIVVSLGVRLVGKPQAHIKILGGFPPASLLGLSLFSEKM